MGVTVNWDHDPAIIIYTFTGRWNWYEFYAALETGVAMLHTATQRVDIIVDMEQCHYLPDDAIAQVKRIARYEYPNAGMVVVAIQNTLLRALFNMFQNLYRTLMRNFQLVYTVEQARSAIYRTRPERETA